MISGEVEIARPPMNQRPERDGPRINRMIRVPEVRLIDAEGENVGVTEFREALNMAESAGLDLVEISPTARPPVCKIMDYGRFKYVEQKKKNEARKKQKIVEIKEIKMRPNIDDNDYNIKMRNVQKFLDNGDKVKFTIRFRGRELAHQNRGMMVLNRVKDDLGETIKVENMPKMEGRQMIMVIAPK